MNVVKKDEKNETESLSETCSLSQLRRVEASRNLASLLWFWAFSWKPSFDVLAEHLVELGEVVLVLGNLSEEVHALLDDILADNLEDLVLLKRLKR